MFDVEYNKELASNLKILVKERPNIPAPTRKQKAISVPGRDGDLYSFEGAIEDIPIPVTFVFKTKPNTWNDTFRKLKKWLLSKVNGELYFSDDPFYFYRVKNIVFGSTQRNAIILGEVEVSFICDGYTYLRYGKEEIDLSDLRENIYEKCKPIYKITGEGVCNLTVNGVTIRANVAQNLTIDTERMITYREDGTLVNTSISGDYEDLYLQPGENTVSVTSGFDCKIIPNWRCL